MPLSIPCQLHPGRVAQAAAMESTWNHSLENALTSQGWRCEEVACLECPNAPSWPQVASFADLEYERRRNQQERAASPVGKKAESALVAKAGSVARLLLGTALIPYPDNLTRRDLIHGPWAGTSSSVASCSRRLMAPSWSKDVGSLAWLGCMDLVIASASRGGCHVGFPARRETVYRYSRPRLGVFEYSRNTYQALECGSFFIIPDESSDA
ncbi:hypothetical protein F4780DRAFT_66527 [Xylariomycetidae sp. FL0641]|nr:hypothetical protein F4780DRAFT_66527 [Xylariomycetidae sp. FL0641]